MFSAVAERFKQVTKCIELKRAVPTMAKSLPNSFFNIRKKIMNANTEIKAYGARSENRLTPSDEKDKKDIKLLKGIITIG